MAQVASLARAVWAAIGRAVDRVPWTDVEEIWTFVIALMPAMVMLVVMAKMGASAWGPLAFIVLSFYGPYRLGKRQWERQLRKAEIAAIEENESVVPPAEELDDEVVKLFGKNVDRTTIREALCAIDPATTASCGVFMAMVDHICAHKRLPRTLVLDWSIAKLLYESAELHDAPTDICIDRIEGWMEVMHKAVNGTGKP